MVGRTVWGVGLSCVLIAVLGCGDDTSGQGGGGGTSSGGASQTGGAGAGGAASGAGGQGGQGGQGGAPEILCDDPASLTTPHFCLGNVTWPTVEPGMHEARLNFHKDFVSDEVLVGLTVRLCAADDLTCATPLAEGVTVQPPTIDDWSVILPMPTDGPGFTGYIEVTDPMNLHNLPPNLIMTHRPYTNDITVDFGVIDNDVVGLLLQMLQTTAKPGHGQAGVSVWSCCDRPTAGASISFDPTDADTVTAYLNGMFADKNATETFDDAMALVANLPAGLVKATGVVAAGNTWIGDVDLVIRDGAVTTVGLVPEPNP